MFSPVWKPMAAAAFASRDAATEASTCERRKKQMSWYWMLTQRAELSVEPRRLPGRRCLRWKNRQPGPRAQSARAATSQSARRKQVDASLAADRQRADLHRRCDFEAGAVFGLDPASQPQQRFARVLVQQLGVELLANQIALATHHDSQQSANGTNGRAHRQPGVFCQLQPLQHVRHVCTAPHHTSV